MNLAQSKMLSAVINLAVEEAGFVSLKAEQHQTIEAYIGVSDVLRWLPTGLGNYLHRSVVNKSLVI